MNDLKHLRRLLGNHENTNYSPHIVKALVDEVETLRKALNCPRCAGTGKVLSAASPYTPSLTALDCGECGDVRQAAREATQGAEQVDDL